MSIFLNILGAPFFATALCGMFLPFVNSKGVLAGMIGPVVPVIIWFLQMFIEVTPNPESRMVTDRFMNGTLVSYHVF